MVCNRDERRTRPIARPPQPWRAKASRATYPQDPVSGGTWIGVNDNELVVALLNRTSTPGVVRQAVRSRGAIVPGLLACASIDQAVKAAGMLDGRLFEPFRLVLVQRWTVVVITSDSGCTSTEAFPLLSPVMFTSSSMGDAVVEVPRRALFEQLVLGSADWLRGQFLFHRHQWPDRREISVHMAREDALTVSRTTIDVAPGTIDLEYQPLTGEALTVPAAA
jgi:uncharacterized protein with NRDE domain